MENLVINITTLLKTAHLPKLHSSFLFCTQNSKEECNFYVILRVKKTTSSPLRCKLYNQILCSFYENTWLCVIYAIWNVFWSCIVCLFVFFYFMWIFSVWSIPISDIVFLLSIFWYLYFSKIDRHYCYLPKRHAFVIAYIMHGILYTLQLLFQV